MEQIQNSNEEQLCQNKRYQFLNSLKSHTNLIKGIIAEKMRLLERIFVLATKLNILDDGCASFSPPYPKELTWKVKGEILHELNSKVQKINQNINQRLKSYNTLRQHHLEFALSTKSIDWVNKSRLNNGSATEKSLIYYVERAYDIMYCLQVYENTIQLCNEKFHVRNTDSIVAYLKAVPLSENFNDLITEVLFNSHLIDRNERMK